MHYISVSVTSNPEISGLVVECRDYSTEEEAGLLVGNSTINTLGIYVYLYIAVLSCMRSPSVEVANEDYLN